MSLIVKENKESTREPVPAGMAHGICYGVIDLGTQPGNPALMIKAARKVIIMFELPDERFDFEKDGKKLNLPRAISSRFTMSLHKKSKLRPALESWRGRPFTPAELEGFDLKNLLGVNGLLNIIHEHRNSKTYANISSISPLMKGHPKKAPENPTVFYSLPEDPKERIVVPNEFPDWIKKLIMGCEEYVAQQEPTDAELANVSKEELDEDVPF